MQQFVSPKEHQNHLTLLTRIRCEEEGKEEKLASGEKRKRAEKEETEKNAPERDNLKII